MASVIDGSDNFDTSTDLVALSGADLTAVGIIGANPYASLCKRDGSIVGGSDKGTFTKWANGNLECAVLIEDPAAVLTASGSSFRSSAAAIGSVTYPLVFTRVDNVHQTSENYAITTFINASPWYVGLTSISTIATYTVTGTISLSIKSTTMGRWK